MSTRFNVVLSDDLNRMIDDTAMRTESNKSEIIRKALQLYLAAQDGKSKGLDLGLFDPATGNVNTKIVGL